LGSPEKFQTPKRKLGAEGAPAQLFRIGAPSAPSLRLGSPKKIFWPPPEKKFRTPKRELGAEGAPARLFRIGAPSAPSSRLGVLKKNSDPPEKIKTFHVLDDKNIPYEMEHLYNLVFGVVDDETTEADIDTIVDNLKQFELKHWVAITKIHVLGDVDCQHEKISNYKNTWIDEDCNLHLNATNLLFREHPCIRCGEHRQEVSCQCLPRDIISWQRARTFRVQ
jgi:hypothetical protein